MAYEMQVILSQDEIVRALYPYVLQRWPEHQLATDEKAFLIVIDPEARGNEVTVKVKLARKPRPGGTEGKP